MLHGPRNNLKYSNSYLCMCHLGLPCLDNMRSIVPTTNGDWMGRTSYLSKKTTLFIDKNVSK